jgi:hypothetical protein
MISKYIDLKKAIYSQTAIKFGIENIPNEEQIENMKRISLNIFDPLYEYILKVNKEKITFNSFFRSEELNKKLGGSKTSQHKKGEAIDIDSSYSNNDIFKYIKLNLNYDQLIAEFSYNGMPSWVHVSLSNKNRKSTLISLKENGKTVYKIYTDELYKKIYG